MVPDVDEIAPPPCAEFEKKIEERISIRLAGLSREKIKAPPFSI